MGSLLLCAFLAQSSTFDLQEVSHATARDAPAMFSLLAARGDFPDAKIHVVVEGKAHPTQVDVRGTWKDGSLRHALLSWQQDVTALTRYSVEISPGIVPPTDTFVVADSLQESLRCTAALRIKGQEDPLFWRLEREAAQDLLEQLQQTDPQTPVDAWGGLVRDIEQRLPLGSHLELVVRWRFFHRWPGARLTLALENCRTDVAPKDLLFEQAVITLEDQQLANLQDQRQLFQTRWIVRGHAGSAPPTLRPHLDLDYLARTGFLPPLDAQHPVTQEQARAYAGKLLRGGGGRGRVPIDSTLGLPLNRGPVSAYQPGTGDRPDIGWLPRWTYAALNGVSDAGWTLTQAGDYNGSGSFPVHNRDPQRGEMGIPHQHPRWRKQMRLGPAKNPQIPNTAHAAHLGAASFVLSGDKVALEEVLSWACWAARDWYPNQGTLKQLGDRKAAWALRNIAFAAAIVPDSHPLHGYFRGVLQRTAEKWRERLPLTHPLGAYGTGGWRASGRKSSPCSLFISPWQNAWFAAQCWAAWKLHDIEVYYELFAQHWKFYAGGYLGEDTFTAANGDLLRQNPRLLMQYSKTVGLYTPRLRTGKWGVTEGSIVPLDNWADAQWYDRIQEDWGRSALTAKNTPFPEAGAEPTHWQPKSGSYRPPRASGYHEYGVRRCGLDFLAAYEGLEGAEDVTRLIEPWVTEALNRKALPVAPGMRLAPLNRSPRGPPKTTATNK